MYRSVIANWPVHKENLRTDLASLMIQENILIINKLGLHARAAAKLVSTASAFASQLQIGHSGRMVDCKSIMSVMMLAASKGTEVQLTAEGADEQAAMEAIIDLINRRFDEDE